MRMQASYLQDGYGGKGRGLTGWYRDLTVAEAREGRFHQLYAVDRNGCVREVRLNGAVKTWKRSPGCELSLKYGLRECFHVNARERIGDEAVSHPGGVRIVVLVQFPFDPSTPPGIVTDWVMDQLAQTA